MTLVTFTFEVAEEEQSEFVEAVGKMQAFWDEEGFTVSLFRDTSCSTHLFQLILTERSVDELTELIQNHPRAKSMFEQIKDAGSRVIVSVMEQIL